jgi:hypothetical protein
MYLKGIVYDCVDWIYLVQNMVSDGQGRNVYRVLMGKAERKRRLERPRRRW